MNRIWVGSKLLTTDESVLHIVQELKKHTLETLKLSDSFIDIHNSYTSYVVMLLMMATGHRPVKDPFCYKCQWDLDLGLMLIDDKVVSDRHRYRLVALPDIAILQIIEYEKHLKWLISHLSITPEAEGLIGAIISHINDGNACTNKKLPFFFYLTRDSGQLKTHSVSESTLEQRIGGFWPLPYNFSRHNISTKLRKLIAVCDEVSLTTSVIEAQLGHMEGLYHPFGVYGTMSPIEFRKIISESLNGVLVKQGWEVIAAKRYFTKIKSRYSEAWEHGEKLLGPDLREVGRIKKTEEDYKVVKAALDVFGIDEIANNPLIVLSVRDEIIEKSQKVNERINIRLLMLWRVLLRLKKIKPQIKLPRRFHIIEPEDSPFSKNSIIEHARARRARQQFISYLQEMGNLQSKAAGVTIDANMRMAEIIISAALFDAVTNNAVLDALWQNKPKLTKEGGVIYFDIIDNNRSEPDVVWRNYPQALTLGLVQSLKSSGLKAQTITEYSFKSCLSKLMTKLGYEGVSKDGCIELLASSANSYWSMYLPPYLREVANGGIYTQPLKESCLVRHIRGERVCIAKRDDLSLELRGDNDTVVYAGTVKGANNSVECAKQFVKYLNEQIRQSAKKNGVNKKSASYVRKAELARRLRSVLSSEHGFPSIGVAIASWTIKLCEKGTDLYGSVAYSTVSSYSRMVSDAIAVVAGNESFFHLSHDQYDYLYDVALESNTHKDKTRFRNNIQDFHNFLAACNLVPELDWSWFGKKSLDGSVSASIDANIVTLGEYQAALELLDELVKSGRYNAALLRKYSGLLLCGYRFSMRISEALSLHYRDIQYLDDLSQIVLHVVNTRFGDTKSAAGRRQIPLLEVLSEIEVNVIRSVFIPITALEDEEYALVFGDPDSPTEKIDISRASRDLQLILKIVSGDPDAHYHLLRHSFGTRIYSKITAQESGYDDEYLSALAGRSCFGDRNVSELLTGGEKKSGKVYKALSVATGHAQLSTTLTHYIHSADYHIKLLAEDRTHWESLSVSRVDYLASYVYGKQWASLAKQRKRKGIEADDINGTLSVAASGVKIEPSSIITTRAPITDIQFMAANNDAFQLTLSRIDDILLMSMAQVSGSDIAERLSINERVVNDVLSAYNKLESLTLYMGYSSRDDDSVSGRRVQPSETRSLRKTLGDIEAVIDAIDDDGRDRVYQGILAWISSYFPKDRYVPLIFDKSDSVYRYLESMKLLGVKSESMSITYPKVKTNWYSVANHNVNGKNIVKLNLVTNEGIKDYVFGSGGVATHIPLPTTNSRYSTKERISISLDKKAAHPLYVQKRLDRLCFLLAIWFEILPKMVDS